MKKKIILAMACLILIFLLTQSNITGWATRTISNTQDNKETMIRNSKGNYWEPTCPNIRTAINDLNNGGKVWLPPGIFMCALPIEPNNNTYIQGSGIGNTIIRADPSFNDINGFGLIKGLESRNLHNISISDMTIDGNRANAPGSCSCINFHGVKDFVIRNVFLENPGGSGLNMRSNCTRGFISNVYTTNILSGAQGITGNALNDCVVSDCIAWNAGGAGMDFSRTHNSTFNNLVVYDSNSGIKVPGIETRHTENCTFNNLVMSKLRGGFGLKVQYTENTNFNNIYVEGAANGINFYSTCDKNNLNNFIIENSSNVGLAISADNIQASNGIIRNTSAYGFQVSGKNTILSNIDVDTAGGENLIQDTENVVLSNSKITNIYDPDFALLIKNSEDVIIQGCEVYNNTGNGIFVYGNTGPNTNFIISDNIVKGNVRGIVVSSHAHDNFIITNNIIRENSITNLLDNTGAVNKIVEENLT